MCVCMHVCACACVRVCVCAGRLKLTVLSEDRLQMKWREADGPVQGYKVRVKPIAGQSYLGTEPLDPVPPYLDANTHRTQTLLYIVLIIVVMVCCCCCCQLRCHGGVQTCPSRS